MRNMKFNYIFLCICFFVVFSGVLIVFIGENILKHEAYVLKTEFINKNEEIVKAISDKLLINMESFDTLGIIDEINQLSEKADVVYTYVLNSESEVIAHSVKNEVLKKYKDDFLKKENIKQLSSNSSKVWINERSYKGNQVLKFSKPLILRFSDNNSNKSNNYIISGVFHIAYSTDQLLIIAGFSRKKMVLYYCFSIIFSIVVGFFAGKIIEHRIRNIIFLQKNILKEGQLQQSDFPKSNDSFNDIYCGLKEIYRKFVGKITSTSTTQINIENNLAAKKKKSKLREF